MKRLVTLGAVLLLALTGCSGSDTKDGGMKLNENFLVDFGKEPHGPARARAGPSHLSSPPVSQSSCGRARAPSEPLRMPLSKSTGIRAGTASTISARTSSVEGS